MLITLASLSHISIFPVAEMSSGVKTPMHSTLLM
nr:MAG TPA_asm: hypothetical protein [Caudoviricetes sp.]